MTAAAAAEMRTSHRATRARVAPALAPRSLSRQVRDNNYHSDSLEDSKTPQHAS